MNGAVLFTIATIITTLLPQIMMETAQERQRLADIEERHQEIMKLENSLRELHDLFMDVAVLVQSQVGN